VVCVAGTDVSLQAKAAKALLFLSMEEGHVRLQILEQGAVPALLRLSTSSTSEQSKRSCAMALCNLLCNEEAQNKIIELKAVGAFEPLSQCDDEDIREKYAVQPSVSLSCPACFVLFVFVLCLTWTVVTAWLTVLLLLLVLLLVVAQRLLPPPELR
jgi:hypothetical protein